MMNQHEVICGDGAKRQDTGVPLSRQLLMVMMRRRRRLCWRWERVDVVGSSCKIQSRGTSDFASVCPVFLWTYGCFSTTVLFCYPAFTSSLRLLTHNSSHNVLRLLHHAVPCAESTTCTGGQDQTCVVSPSVVLQATWLMVEFSDPKINVF